MKAFFALLSMLALATPLASFAATKTYDCTIKNDPLYSDVHFSLDESSKLISGNATFLGSRWVGLEGQDVPLKPSDLSVDPDGSLRVGSFALGGHDGVDFSLEIKASGEASFESSEWVDCVGYQSYQSPVSCQISE